MVLHRNARRTLPVVGATIALVVLLGPSSGPTSSILRDSATAPSSSHGEGAFPIVEGRLLGPNGAGLAGVEVSAVVYPCPTPPATPAAISGCTIAATGISDSNGAFALTLPSENSAYYLVANRTPTTGGTGLWFRTSGALTLLPTMTAPGYVPYGNRTIVLPGYDNLTRYFTHENLNVQVPVLSWTADGAFYVNSALDLVFDNFATGEVRRIAPWLPLYQNVMNYAGVENTEWATSDGSFVYEFGCLALCVNTSRITFYGVNVTTGTTYEWNFTGVVDASTRLNAQLNVVGRAGASTDAVLILQSGEMLDWNLANGTQWTLGILPFFEANNAYWVPTLDAWFDVTANNLSRDEIAELGYTGTTVKVEAAGFWGANVPSNFVGGMEYNLTSHRLYFTAGTCRTNQVVTAYATIGPGGLMTGVNSLGISGCGFTHPLPQAPPGEPVGSSEHRIGIASSGPWVAGAWNSTFENDSWLVDPSDRVWTSPNVSQSWGVRSPNESSQPSYDEEGLFYDGDYLIGLPSAACAGHAPCSIDERSNPGTIAWEWKLGLPEFPFPANAPLAETAVPPTPGLVNTSVNRTTVVLDWSEGAVPAASLLNETVYFTTTDPIGGPNGSVSLPGDARSVVLSDLEPRTCYQFEVVALNLHGESAPLSKSLCTGPTAPPGPPYWFNATAVSDSSIALSWHNPDGPLVNDTIFSGPDCARMTAVSLGRPATSFELDGLASATVRCFQVQAWAATGPSNISPELLASSLPAPPVGLSVADGPGTALSLGWIQPSGTVVNDTIRSGPDCTHLQAQPTDGPTDHWELAGLAPDRPYCLAVEAWGLSGPNRTWAWANATTVPAVPPEVAALAAGPGSIVARWTAEASRDSAVSVGASCASASIRWIGPANTTLVSGLSEDTSYCVFVQLLGAAGPGPPSPSVEVTTLPDPPTGLTVGVLGGGRYLLDWTNPPGNLTNLTVYGGPACVPEVLAVLPGTAQEVEFDNLTISGGGCFGVAATGSSGSSTIVWIDAESPARPGSSGGFDDLRGGLESVGVLAVGALVAGAVVLSIRRARSKRRP